MRKKFRFQALAVLLALMLLAAGCGGSEPAEEETSPEAVPTFPAGSTMDTIQKKGSVTVGTKFDQPLFGQKNPINEEIEGFDVEIAKIIAQGIFGGSLDDVKSKVNFVETVSAVREANITQGSVDYITATYTINDTRKQVVDFAGPYYIAGQDIMVKKDEDSIKGVEDLNGKKVCSVQGSTSIKNLQEKAPQADVSISFDSYSKCAEALTDDRVEAVTTDNVILAGLIKADLSNSFKLVDNPFTTEPYGVGLKKGDDDFRAFINDELEKAYENGEWAAAWERTVGTAGIATPEPPEVDRYTSSGSPAPSGSPAASPGSSPAASSVTTAVTTTAAN